MHTNKTDTATDNKAPSGGAFRRSVLRKRDIRSLRRFNHGLYH